MDPVLGHDCPDDALSAALDLVLNEEDENEEQQERHEEQQAEDVVWSLLRPTDGSVDVRVR